MNKQTDISLDIRVSINRLTALRRMRDSKNVGDLVDIAHSIAAKKAFLGMALGYIYINLDMAFQSLGLDFAEAVNTAFFDEQLAIGYKEEK